jgi:hypothetical protein
VSISVYPWFKCRFQVDRAGRCGALFLRDYPVRALVVGQYPESLLSLDPVSQLALIAKTRGRDLHEDPRAKRYANDGTANALLQARPFRGEWKLPVV